MGCLKLAIERAKPIPQYLGLTQETEELIDEVQEQAFRFLLGALQSYKAEIAATADGVEFVKQIVQI